MSRPPASREVTLDGTLVAILQGESVPVAGTAEGELALSRFAWLRQSGGTVVAETALAAAKVELSDPRAAALVLVFVAPRRLDQAAAAGAGLPVETASEVVELLRAAAVLVDADAWANEEAKPLAVWEFHDLLFHARTRGRNRSPVGGTYRFLERFGPAPAIRPSFSEEITQLNPPDFDRLEADDPPLSLVQSQRRSIRDYGEEPLSVDALSEFLYRVGRIEELWTLPIPGPPPNEIALLAKPYPSGGSLYELELYPVVARCDGLDAGLYHYQPDRHRLARVDGGSGVDDLLSSGAAAMGRPAGSLQVLLVITARFERLAWKYESIAYDLVLKHVGVLIQTMYLAATAMGLAPCALGTGNSDVFAQASGIPYYVEPSVGELALGSRPPEAV